MGRYDALVDTSFLLLAFSMSGANHDDVHGSPLAGAGRPSSLLVSEKEFVSLTRQKWQILKAYSTVISRSSRLATTRSRACSKLLCGSLSCC
jgi:hypothetical protein